ncbi:hypothetical protein CHU_1566 [Cytophaga hutchinsonii ATCC 33406]|uniref:Uncharacterized protein n=2 Tax=Cytophaga hutchinsonii TaxID=985 RepID=A0A6N4SR47_CYTH3|nr:hypothetical protein CHU_1566 [Cytophaga hutchinsonii ATCC 33406]
MVACKNTDKPAEENKTVEVPVEKEKTTAEQLSALNDSANVKWAAMAKLDSQKFADIKRLLEEISYCKKYDENAVQKLLKLNTEVHAMAYTQGNLSDSLIDLYDARTTDLINKVRNLKSKTEEISQHPLADQLENEILAADEALLRYRNNYDQAAGAYNSFLEQNKEAIAADPALVTYQKRKLFSIVL